jgi:hypothetical protein
MVEGSGPIRNKVSLLASRCRKVGNESRNQSLTPGASFSVALFVPLSTLFLYVFLCVCTRGEEATADLKAMLISKYEASLKIPVAITVRFSSVLILFSCFSNRALATLCLPFSSVSLLSPSATSSRS